MTDPSASDKAERVLIVNGDDFGRTPGINNGVIRAHEHGILTSASLMVRWPAAVEAARYGRDRPTLDLGVHLDFGEWVFREGAWHEVYSVVDSGDGDAVRAEVHAQLEAFRCLVGRNPTHLDSHQHVHLREPVRTAVLEQSRRLQVPARGCGPDIRHCGDFYGQTGTGEPWPANITVEAFVRIVKGLPPGVTELGCHPGENGDFDSVYRVERTSELQVLCDPAVSRALTAADVRLAAFSSVAAARPDPHAMVQQPASQSEREEC